VLIRPGRKRDLIDFLQSGGVPKRLPVSLGLKWDGLASPRLVGLGPKNFIIYEMYYVYLLYSKTSNKIYKGSTSNLKGRYNDHNSGKVKSTKNGKPWILIYYEAFLNKTDCLIEEKFLKSGKGKERIKYLLENYF
jgi:putative endonuclease